MSLQVWLPLNGDLRNQGLSDVQVTTPTAATFDNAGKIGKCLLYNDKISIPATQVASIFNNEHMSIAFWYNNNGGSTSSHAICGFQGNSEGDSGASRIYDFFQYSSKNDFHWSMDTLGVGVLNGVIPDNTWTHICVIYNSGNLKIYINGILKHDSSGHSSAYTFNKSYYINFGYGQKLNDFRIYDHALSLREVKELAKGLILHYPLNKPMPNLIIGSDKYLQNKPYTHTSSAKDGISFIGSDVWMPCTPGKTYTFQFNTDGIWAPTHDASGNGGGKTHFYLYLMEDSTNPGDFARPVDLTNNFKVNDNITGLGIWTYTIPTDKAYTKIMFRVDIHSNGSTSYTCHYWNFKAEEGNKATAWIPNESDPLYAAAGYASGIVYDCSGYQNNGIEVGTITGSSDTPRYRSSEYFPSGANYINAGRGAMVTDAITVNLWMKCSTWGNVTSCTEGGGWNFEEYNGGIRFPVYTTDNVYQVAQSTITSASLKNNWHMLTGTYDGLIAKIYIDGEEKGSITCSTTHKDIKYNVSNVIFIGAEASGNANTPADSNYIGNMSDFRVYATALSADDIKALYEDAGYVDKNGNFHAYEFVEI